MEEMKRSEKGFRKISIGRGGVERDIWQIQIVQGIRVTERKSELISGSKRQTEMI